MSELLPEPVLATYVKRRRTPGWTKPAGAVSCTRGSVNVGLWGNPFRVGSQQDDGTVIADHVHAVRAYAAWLRTQPERMARAVREIASKTLMCWCAAGQPCHVQAVLIPLVNEGRLP